MADIIRAFIAFELPERIISSIRNVQDGIKNYGFKVRWVRPENIHLTLKFLGDIEEADTEVVGGTISEAVKGYGPISLAAKGIGVFPGIKRPRVIWVGLTGQMESLIDLHESLDENLETIGFTRENRPFKGHLTLGRAKGNIDPKRLFDAMEEFKAFESETFVANQIILFKSELKPSGSVYTKLKSVSLV